MDYNKSRSVESTANRSIVSLGMRQILVQGSNIIGTIYVARNASTSEFGFFAVTGFFLTFLIAFSDVGLGASLIRQEAEPNENEYNSVFTVQQIIIGSLCIIIFLLSSYLSRAYGFGDSRYFILLGCAFFITTFQTLPQVKLERSINFSKIALAEVCQALLYNISLIIFTYLHLNALGFSLAVLVRSFAGAIVINIIQPMKYRYYIDKSFISNNLGFSIYYQSAKFISLIKDSIIPLYIGFTIGKSAVGIINWSSTIAGYSIMALSVLQRIYMPVFSRLQSDKFRLSSYVSQSLYLVYNIVAPLSVFTLVFIYPLTKVIFGEKWIAYIDIFYVFWAANLLVPASSVLQGLLNALGKSKVVVSFSVLWLSLTWLFGAPLIHYFGSIGFAYANLIVQMTNFILFFVASRYVHLSWKSFGMLSWLSSAIAGTLLYYLLNFIPPITKILEIVGYGIIYIAIYLVILIIIDTKMRSRIVNIKERLLNA